MLLLCYVIKVRRLLAVCPKNTGGAFRVDQRGLDAIVALGIYHLESGLKASIYFIVETVLCQAHCLMIVAAKVCYGRVSVQCLQRK